MRRILWILSGLSVALVAQEADADLRKNVTDAALGTQTGGWTNKADVADVDGDGRVDLLFAGGSAYNRPQDAERNGIWLGVGNDDAGRPQFKDVSEEILGDSVDFTRVFKGRDVNGDGIVDLIAGNTYETQSRLYLGLGGGEFKDRTDLLPQTDASIGDLEVGDIDGDGDLDLVLADWGLDDPDGGPMLDPFTAPGGQMLVWLNELDGPQGRFVDVTDQRMPTDKLVAWAWELELIDVDADFDLDVLASCKVCEGSALFRNDDGAFSFDADGVPAFTNNYDFEPMFLEIPGAPSKQLAVVTINDGTQASSDQLDLRERIFVANEQGRFDDATLRLWPDEDNAGADDNMVVVFDADSDGDPDFLIGALGGGPDRLHINQLDEDGRFRLVEDTGLDDTPGTLGVAVADLNGDGKLDVVQSQGELANPEQIWLGDDIPPDTADPIIEAIRTSDDGLVLARIHDNKSPSRVHDWESVVVHWAVGDQTQDDVPMQWTGEFYWRAQLPQVASRTEVSFTVCAVDAASNSTCSEPVALAEPKSDAVEDDVNDTSAEGCGCNAGPADPAHGLLLLSLLALRRRRGTRAV